MKWKYKGTRNNSAHSQRTLQTKVRNTLEATMELSTLLSWQFLFPFFLSLFSVSLLAFLLLSPVTIYTFCFLFWMSKQPLLAHLTLLLPLPNGYWLTDPLSLNEISFPTKTQLFLPFFFLTWASQPKKIPFSHLFSAPRGPITTETDPSSFFQTVEEQKKLPSSFLLLPKPSANQPCEHIQNGFL